MYVILHVDLEPVYDLAPPRGNFQGYDFLNPHCSGHSLVKVCKVLLGGGAKVYLAHGLMLLVQVNLVEKGALTNAKKNIQMLQGL